MKYLLSIFMFFILIQLYAQAVWEEPKCVFESKGYFVYDMANHVNDYSTNYVLYKESKIDESGIFLKSVTADGFQIGDAIQLNDFSPQANKGFIAPCENFLYIVFQTNFQNTNGWFIQKYDLEFQPLWNDPIILSEVNGVVNDFKYVVDEDNTLHLAWVESSNLYTNSISTSGAIEHPENPLLIANSIDHLIQFNVSNDSKYILYNDQNILYLNKDNTPHIIINNLNLTNSLADFTIFDNQICIAYSSDNNSCISIYDDQMNYNINTITIAYTIPLLIDNFNGNIILIGVQTNGYKVIKIDFNGNVNQQTINYSLEFMEKLFKKKCFSTPDSHYYVLHTQEDPVHGPYRNILTVKVTNNFSISCNSFINSDYTTNNFVNCLLSDDFIIYLMKYNNTYKLRKVNQNTMSGSGDFITLFNTLQSYGTNFLNKPIFNKNYIIYDKKYIISIDHNGYSDIREHTYNSFDFHALVSPFHYFDYYLDFEEVPSISFCYMRLNIYNNQNVILNSFSNSSEGYRFILDYFIEDNLSVLNTYCYSGESLDITNITINQDLQIQNNNYYKDLSIYPKFIQHNYIIGTHQSSWKLLKVNNSFNVDENWNIEGSDLPLQANYDSDICLYLIESANGVLVLWSTYSNFTTYNYYALLFDSQNGEKLWDTPLLIGSGSKNFKFYYDDNLNECYLMYVSSTNQLKCKSFSIISDNYLLGYDVIVSDYVNELYDFTKGNDIILCYMDNNSNICVKKINQSGFISPINQSYIINQFNLYKTCLKIALYSENSAYVSWIENTNNQMKKIYTQLVNFDLLQHNDQIPTHHKPSLIYHYSPYPYNNVTKLSFDLVQNSEVEISIYNIKGQKVKTLQKGMMTAGNHSIYWNGKDENNQNIASGIYFCRYLINNESVIRKMTLIK